MNDLTQKDFDDLEALLLEQRHQEYKTKGLISRIQKRSFVAFEVNLKFWAILPCINLNFNSGELEIEWLCFGLYFKIF